nr:hypothetical protein CFP56_50810 [Quercus suber]
MRKDPFRQNPSHIERKESYDLAYAGVYMLAFPDFLPDLLILRVSRLPLDLMLLRLGRLSQVTQIPRRNRAMPSYAQVHSTAWVLVSHLQRRCEP